METYRIRYLDGSHAIQAIKLVREFTALGLREAKEIVDGGGVILDGVAAAEARRIADQFGQIGAQVEVERTWRTMLAFDPHDPARGDQQLERLRVGEDELELERGELGAWTGGESEGFAAPELVERRVVELLGDWQARGLAVAEDELAVLERVSAREPKLEQQLRDNPEGVEAPQIYGDWLQARGDARGQLIALHCALERADEGVIVPRVVLAPDGSVVGRVNLNNVVRGAFQSCSLGYWLDEGHTGRGLATAAVAEMLVVAFDELGLHRVEAGTLVHNVASQTVLARNGFERFGLAPGYLRIAGRWQDHVLFQRLSPHAG